MKKITLAVIVSSVILGASIIFVASVASAPTSAQPVELTRQPTFSIGLHPPYSTGVLTPTVFLPVVLFNAPGQHIRVPTVQFSSSGYSVHEGAGKATIIATLSAASDVTVTVRYATSDGTARAGSDYVAAEGTLSFAPGQLSRILAVTIIDDAYDETGETVNLTLSNPTNATLGTPHTSVLTIVDSTGPLTVQFNSDSYSASEEGGTATIIATLSAASDVTVTVDYATADGTAQAGDDYPATSGTLTFTPAETSKAFNVEIYDDPFDEPDETLTLALSSPVNATLGTPYMATLTIADEDLPSRFALHFFLGQSTNITLTTALKESGAGWARFALRWKGIERNAPQPGQPPDYSWSWHDDRLRLVSETGVRMIVMVKSPPDWASSVPCGPIYPDRLDEFARFLTDLVNRYKGPPYFIKYWELLNEPDYDGSEGDDLYACYGNDGDQYAQMLALAYPAIKAADPEATVLMGGLAYDRFTEYGGPFVRYFPDEVMAHGGGIYIDALNIHYFTVFHAEWERWGPGNLPTCGVLDDGIGAPYQVWGTDVIAKTSHFRNRMSICHGVNKPVWITELGEKGYPDNPNSLDRQARYVIQGNVRGLAAGAENITWFALSTPGSPWEYQLLADDGTRKPAYYTFQTLNSELSGYEYAQALDVVDVEGYVFQKPGQPDKTVAWGSGRLTLSPAGQLHVIDREGNETIILDGGSGDADGTQNGAVELQLSVDPVFVTVSGG